ncbi:hypothetical protein NUM3379_41790 [Kineococcus sp. NUM-3379]
MTRALVLALLVLAVLAAPAAAGVRVYVDRSESMAPAVRAGDLVVTRPVVVRDLRVGDVVTAPVGEGGTNITHRVVAVRPDGDRYRVTTKGDANASGEDWSEAGGARVGVSVAHVPWAGYAVAYLGSPSGWLTVGGIAGALLLWPPRPARQDARPALPTRAGEVVP